MIVQFSIVSVNAIVCVEALAHLTGGLLKLLHLVEFVCRIDQLAEVGLEPLLDVVSRLLRLVIGHALRLVPFLNRFVVAALLELDGHARCDLGGGDVAVNFSFRRFLSTLP